MAGTFDQDDMRAFMEDHFRPFLERFDKHMESDDRRFHQMTEAITRISTSIEVSTSVQAALLSQSHRLLDGKWMKASVAALFLAPIISGVAVIVAILK